MRKFLDPSVNHQYDKQPYPWRQIRYAEAVSYTHLEQMRIREVNIENNFLIMIGNSSWGIILTLH